jgi:VWFA-related protein
MTRGCRRVPSSVILVALTAAGAAGVLTLDAQQPSFRAGVNFVRVDAIAVDKSGAFVPDLTAQDFQVSELGKPQTIQTFQRVLLDGGLMASDTTLLQPIRNDDDERREAARADVRLFAIFLDEYHVSREASLQTRDTIARFIANDLGPADMVALMTPLSPLASVVMLRNHESIEHEIEQFLGRKGEYEPPKNVAEENLLRASSGNPATIEMIRNQVAYSALDGLILHLGGLRDARKTLILVTEGFAGGLRDRPGSRGGLYLPDLYTDANRGNVAVYWIDPRRLAALAPGDGDWVWDDRTETLGWKPGPVSLRSRALQQDPLGALALYTDGRAIINRNDLAAAMKDVVRDMSGYYLLGYTSTLDAMDGRFHDISVHVQRPGVSVRARKGYWAYTKSEVAEASAAPPPPLAPDIRAAIDAAFRDDREGAPRRWIGFEQGVSGRTKVSIVWDADTRLAAGGAPSAPAMTLTASGSDGTLYFRGRVSASVAFLAAPGAMTLRVSIRQPDGEDAQTTSVMVPDFTSGEARLATPQVFRSPTAAGLKRVDASPDARPTAVRVFARSDHVRLRVPAYNAGEDERAFTAHLLNASGAALRELPIGLRDGAIECELPLASLAAADYVVDISGTQPAARALVAFRVTNQ